MPNMHHTHLQTRFSLYYFEYDSKSMATWILSGLQQANQSGKARKQVWCMHGCVRIWVCKDVGVVQCLTALTTLWTELSGSFGVARWALFVYFSFSTLQAPSHQQEQVEKFFAKIDFKLGWTVKTMNTIKAWMKTHKKTTLQWKDGGKERKDYVYPTSVACILVINMVSTDTG